MVTISPGRHSLTWLWLSLLGYSALFGLLRTALSAYSLSEGAVLLISSAAASAVPLVCAGLNGCKIPPLPTEQASVGQLFLLLSAALSANLAVMLAAPVLERLWGLAGLTAQGSSGGDAPVTPLLAAYVCVVGPVLEELIYRGVVMRSLMPVGPQRAVLVSALCFGLMHHDWYQGLSAFLSGLVFGYAALHYGLSMSIGLHISGNTIAVLLPTLRQTGTVGALAVLVLVFVPVLTTVVAGIRLLLGRRSPEKRGRQAGGALWRDPALWVLLVFDTVYLLTASFARR